MAVPRCGPSAILMHTAVIAKADMNYCLINKEEVLRIGYPPKKNGASNLRQQAVPETLGRGSYYGGCY